MTPRKTNPHSPTEVLSWRIPGVLAEQLDALCALYGMNRVQIINMLISREYGWKLFTDPPAQEMPATYADNGGNLDAVWSSTRFVYGTFEAPTMAPVDPSAILPAPVAGQENPAAAGKLVSSTLYGQVSALVASARIDRVEALELLDLGYKVMTSNKNERQANRLTGLQKYFEVGGSSAGVELVVDTQNVDLIDLIYTRRSLNGKSIALLAAGK